MKDMIPKGTGNSRFLRSVSNFKAIYPTYDDFVNALVAGTLPVDFNGINEAGIQQVGTALNKANLLTDETAALLGMEQENPTVNEAFRQISLPQAGTGTLYVYCKDEAGAPVSGCVVQIGEEMAVTGASGAVKYFLAPGTYSVAIRSPIDYGVESQTVSVTVALSETVIVNATVQDSLNGAKELRLTSSVANAAFSNRVTSADVFGVGGGGSGGRSSNTTYPSATGGAGGKTKTVTGLDVRDVFAIIVGSGGAAVTGSGQPASAGKAGGTTVVKTVAGETVLSCAGGEGGKATVSQTGIAGASGGSGSGAAIGQWYEENYNGKGFDAGASGFDGSSGGNVHYSNTHYGGSGQGTTTRAFGEPDGELFASAGASVGSYGGTYTVIGTHGPGGGDAAASTGAAIAGSGSTPGSGGGAASSTNTSSVEVTSGAGADGIVIFRWEVAA